MPEIGSYVIYGTEGVCEITGKKRVAVFGGPRSYLILSPLTDPGEEIYIDEENHTLISKIRRLVTREEIFRLIGCLPDTTLPWIEDPRERKLNYIRILKEGDRLKQLALIKSIRTKRAELFPARKKLWAIDEAAVRAAENLIFTEFGLVLDLAPEQIPDFIQSVISAEMA